MHLNIQNAWGIVHNHMTSQITLSPKNALLFILIKGLIEINSNLIILLMLSTLHTIPAQLS